MNQCEHCLYFTDAKLTDFYGHGVCALCHEFLTGRFHLVHDNQLETLFTGLTHASTAMWTTNALLRGMGK